MNHQYEAIIALGKSIKEIDQNGWRKGDLGDPHTSKCAIGLLSFAAIGSICYLDDMTFHNTHRLEGASLKVAARALFKTLTPEQLALTREACETLDDQQMVEWSMPAFRACTQDDARLAQWEAVVVLANDKVIKDQAQARQWFSDAIDLLAEGLPVPGAPLFGHRVEVEAI